MFRKALIIIGSGLNILWGVAHLFPVNSVVSGFGDISTDNKRIVLMEWINEGFTLIFIGSLVLVVTLINKENNKTSKIVYIASSIMLFSMGILSLFTGFKINYVAFKLCPVIFFVSGIFTFQGAFRK